jgi:cysteine desulfurase
MRGGTENVHSILGMAKALELALAEREKREAQIRAVRDALALRLTNVFPEVVFNGDPFGKGHYKILSAAFPPSAKAELLLLNLDIAGVAVSGGSACSSGADAGSHVLDALAKDSPRKTLRFSFSHHNTVEEVDYLIGKLVEILR